MKKRKRSWLSLSLLAGTVLLLAACGNGNEEANNTGEDGKKTLEFWSFWGSGPRREKIEALIEDFNASQDEIEVEHVYQPWGDIWTKSLASIAAGDPPDIIVQDINSVEQRADAQQAMSIQSYLDEEDEDIQSRFYPQLWDTVLYEDEAYALPFNTDTQVLFYNKDLFEEVGLDPENPPKTWEELEEYARALDKKNGDSWERIGFYPLWNLGTDVWALNADNGTSWFDEEGNVTINTPKKVEALEWILEWQDYYGEDTINTYEAEFGSGVSDPFVSGLVGIRAQNINYYTELLENAPDDFNFGVVALPEHEEGSGNWSWGGGFVLEIPDGAENPEASYEFMKYLTSTEVQEEFGLNSFDIMANKEANENLTKHPDLDEEGQMIYELADKNLEETVITPVPLTAPDFSALVNEQIDEALLGNKTAKEALDDAQSSVESLVEQNK
ncbi:MAG: ABC transporter substrate-binding protein [Carnobacterium sp.]|uniref:ABC transporter substrate-binding protein n=1 Tax=Carnobacterium sp. TaxID=48221 RepID=UPI003315ECEC